MHRRQLLQLILPAGLLWLPWSAARTADGQGQGPPARSLVLLELQGGNDGLNTLVPYADPTYYRLRPKLAVARDQVLTLDDRLGLNPALGPLMPAWRVGDLAWVQGVGYEQQNRSHFRSIVVWETASDSTEVMDQGWVAQTLPMQVRGLEGVPDAVVLGGADGAVRGEECQVVTLQDPEQLARETKRMSTADDPADAHGALAHILDVQATLRQAGEQFRLRLGRLGEVTDSFPDTPLGKQLKQVVRMLSAGLPIPVFKLQIAGFDTHVQQRARHDRLLAQLADALAAFRLALIERGRWDQVLVMSYSEFGRRVAENANAGTDHGAAAPHLVMGGKVKGGLYGEPPSLETLNRGDLTYTTDYRQLYATVAKGWWGSQPAGWDGRFKPLGFV